MIVVDGATTHSQKDGVEGSRGSLKVEQRPCTAPARRSAGSVV